MDQVFRNVGIVDFADANCEVQNRHGKVSFRKICANVAENLIAICIGYPAQLTIIFIPPNATFMRPPHQLFRSDFLLARERIPFPTFFQPHPT